MQRQVNERLDERRVTRGASDPPRPFTARVLAVGSCDAAIDRRQRPRTRGRRRLRTATDRTRLSVGPIVTFDCVVVGTSEKTYCLWRRRNKLAQLTAHFCRHLSVNNYRSSVSQTLETRNSMASLLCLCRASWSRTGARTDSMIRMNIASCAYRRTEAQTFSGLNMKHTVAANAVK